VTQPAKEDQHHDDVELVCREVVELVTEYLGQTLAPADRRRFERHLSTCPPCTSYLAQIRDTLELAGDLGKAEVTGDAKRELVNLFRTWHEKK
jgi:anti-sigma factor RsiW